MRMKPRVLLVDDSAISLAYTEQKLKDRYEIVAVNSGSRAIRYLKGERPDVILLDIRMAEMDGIETLKEIRALENGAEIPVIMLTSKSDRESIVESQKLEIDDYVLKPFEAEELCARIQHVLEKEKNG